MAHDPNFPALKKARRSIYDVKREQQLRAGRPTASQQPTQEEMSDAITAITPPQLLRGESMSDVVGLIEETTDNKHFAWAASCQRQQLELAQQDDSRVVVESLPDLRSSEDITSDFSAKSRLRLVTPQMSFRWLWRLPPTLRCRPLLAKPEDTREKSREAVLEVCRECLPLLTSDPDKAVLWMQRIMACLGWYELEGPPMPIHSGGSYGGGPRAAQKTLAIRAAADIPEVRAAWRRVEEWDEALRSLELLLRQGIVPSFVIVAERFSVTVLGEGSGPWTSSLTGDVQRPTSKSPCAVLCPSVNELREMLQANHVPFDIAEVAGGVANADATAAQGMRNLCGHVSDEAPPAESCTETLPATQPGVVVPWAPAAPAPVVPWSPAAPALAAAAMAAENRSEIRELRRDGMKVVTEDISGVRPESSALWFDGSWRVHALIDILRQHFLGSPLPSSASMPARLPRLLASAPFVHATARFAEVVKTQTTHESSATSGAAPAPANGSGGDGCEEPRHSAELSGWFCPSQVRKLLELLRVPLRSFSCAFSVDSKHCLGMNTFTQLGMRRIESVACECTSAMPAGASNFKWEFKLGS